eukprot:COSAG05_NODE_11470_length_512_cov_0.588378_1_plen_55_part_10
MNRLVQPPSSPGAQRPARPASPDLTHAPSDTPDGPTVPLAIDSNGEIRLTAPGTG